jgi:hypothetical protein
MILCSVESALNLDFLKINNQFRDKELNANSEEKTGFFEYKGRVKATNLRGEISTGFLFPPEYLLKWQPSVENVKWEDYVDTTFDTFNGVQFSKKYIIQQNNHVGKGEKRNKRDNKLKSFDRLIPGIFKFHINTEQLQRNIHKVHPDDIIQITEKWHGTSGVFSNIPTKRKLSFIERLGKKLGVKIEEVIYDNVYSSRTVIKNSTINKNIGEGYYGKLDVWSEANKIIAPKLLKNMSIYAEICGYLPGSQTTMIQKNYDYGCKPGEYKIVVYRITLTNPDGDVFEFSTQQVKDFCTKNDLQPVKELYYGRARDLYTELSTENHWHENFLEKMMNEKRWNMEENDRSCLNSVAFEGVVLRREVSYIDVYKLKCKRFLVGESKFLDSGEMDVETSEGEIN